MPFTHSFTAITPPPRYDGLPWTALLVYQSETMVTGALIQTIPLAPDATPDTPDPVNVTVTLAPFETGYFVFRFRDASGATTATSAAVLSPSAMTGVFYGTVAALQAETADNAFTTTAATKLLTSASDLVDGMLGAWEVDSVTGRKILEIDVLAWQWVKLARATVLLATKMHDDPTVLTGQQWNSVSGPDFSFSGPLGGALGAEFRILLTDTGLQRLATRAYAGTTGPLIARRFFHTRNPIRRYR